MFAGSCCTLLYMYNTNRVFERIHLRLLLMKVTLKTSLPGSLDILSKSLFRMRARGAAGAYNMYNMYNILQLAVTGGYR